MQTNCPQLIIAKLFSAIEEQMLTCHFQKKNCFCFGANVVFVNKLCQKLHLFQIKMSCLTFFRVFLDLRYNEKFDLGNQFKLLKII